MIHKCKDVVLGHFEGVLCGIAHVVVYLCPNFSVQTYLKKRNKTEKPSEMKSSFCSQIKSVQKSGWLIRVFFFCVQLRILYLFATTNIFCFQHY